MHASFPAPETALDGQSTTFIVPSLTLFTHVPFHVCNLLSLPTRRPSLSFPPPCYTNLPSTFLSFLPGKPLFHSPSFTLQSTHVSPYSVQVPYKRVTQHHLSFVPSITCLSAHDSPHCFPFHFARVTGYHFSYIY